MNQDQAQGLVRALMAWLSGVMVGRGWGDAQLWIALTGVAVAAVPSVWTWLAHTSGAKLTAAARVPDTVIVTKPSIANSPAMGDVPNIVAPKDAAAVIAQVVDGKR